MTQHIPFDASALRPDQRAILEEYLGTQQELLRAIETGALSAYTPYPHQLRLHEAAENTRFLLGANKIGKTWFLNEEIRWYALGEHPYRNLPGPAKLIWACCPTEELMLMYQFPGVRAAIGEENIAEIKMGPHPRIILKNGCKILFKYYAQGARAFPSASVDLVALDEEPTLTIFHEIWARRGTGELNIIGAITTVGGMTPFIQRIVKGTTPKGGALVRSEILPDCVYTTAHIDENPAIPESERKKFKEGYKNDPVMYRIRCLGEILDVGGECRFDKNALQWMQDNDAKDPIARLDFDFDDERWVQTDHGRLWVWKFPEKGHEYVIGGDTAEGLNVSESEADPVWDNTVLQIFDRNTREFVAEYTSGDIEPGKIGEYILPRLHRSYNRGKANIEINYHGYTVVTIARKQMGSYLWSPIEDRTERGPVPDSRMGTLVSSKNRSFAIDVLAEAIHDRDITIYSGHTIQEMMQFVRKANRRVEHQDGAKDDRVFAAMHALVCDRDLPPPKLRRPQTEHETLRKLATEIPKQRRRVQWFRKVA